MTIDRLRLLAACLVGSLPLAACMSDLVDASPSPTVSITSASDSTTTAPTTTTVAATTTTAPPAYVWPDDIEGSVGNWHVVLGGFEVSLVRTIEDLADAATLVVVAVPVGPGPSITLGGDLDNNEVTTSPSRVVEVVDVLRSRSHLYGFEPVMVGDQITVILDHSPWRPELRHPAVLFLTDPRDPRYLWDFDAEHIAPEHRDYVMENWEAWNEFRVGKFQFYNSQSVFVGSARETVMPMRWPNQRDALDPHLDGVPIAEIVELIRSMPAPEA